MKLKNRHKLNKYMYGKFHHDICEFEAEIGNLFSKFLDSHYGLPSNLNNDICDLRNETMDLFHSWIGTKKLEKRFGIKIPLHTAPNSFKIFLEKKGASFNKNYKPCQICKERRITEYCHIIPSSYGGLNDESNYIVLCPNHHHLFDYNRLRKEEFKKLNFSKKSKAAREYINKIKLPQLEAFWKKQNFTGN